VRGVTAQRDGRVEQMRTSVWFMPLAVTTGLAALTVLLLRVRPVPETAFAEWPFSADASAARSMLQTVASAAMTAASLTFSLTVVALQLAAQQFSPRLLRQFARDRMIQATMAVLVSAFVTAILTMRGLDPERPLPVLALLLVLLLGLGSGGLLLVFIGHMVRSLRVDTMMASVHGDTRNSAYDAYPPSDDDAAPPVDQDLPGPAGGTLVPCRESGFVQSIDPEPLVELAARHGVLLRLGIRPGDSIVVGTPIASAWRDDGSPVPVDALADGLTKAVDLGHERTEEQDIAFGFRQLVDIAIKAISPGINDPTTAAEALNYCADLLVLLQARRLGGQVKRDRDGTVRVVLPDRDYRYYLDLSCSQVRRFGRSDPTVLCALMRLLRDCATSARDQDQRAALAEQVDLVLAEMSEDLLPRDADDVRNLAERVRMALAGDVDTAFRDVAGETRSVRGRVGGRAQVLPRRALSGA
jgi:uncharacterized membrane protein